MGNFSPAESAVDEMERNAQPRPSRLQLPPDAVDMEHMATVELYDGGGVQLVAVADAAEVAAGELLVFAGAVLGKTWPTRVGAILRWLRNNISLRCY